MEIRAGMKGTVVLVVASWICLNLALPHPAGAQSTINLVTSRSALGANDSVDWGSLGPTGSLVTSPFTVKSPGGLTITGTLPTGQGPFDILVQCATPGMGGPNCSLAGNFSPGDNILFTNFSQVGPLTLAFSAPVVGVGMQMENDFVSSFTGTIQAFNGSTLLGTVSEPGTDSANADGSAIFIGVQSSSANITSIVVSTNDSSGNLGPLLLNKLSIRRNGCQVNNVVPVGQCDSAWACTQYALHCGKTMCDLGCATSSLSMALGAAGISIVPVSATGVSQANSCSLPAPHSPAGMCSSVTQFPSASGLLANNPGFLNEFMITNAGYTDDNDVDFDSATFEAGLLGGGKVLFFDQSLRGMNSLNCSSNQGTSCPPINALKNELCQGGNPVIVAVAPVNQCVVQFAPPGGHYVLVTGEQDDADGNAHFTIVDPGCRVPVPITSLDAYSNEFEIRGFVSDPPTDISRLDVNVGDAADIIITDQSGNHTGFDSTTNQILTEIPQSNYARDFLTDDQTGEQVTGTAHSAQVFRPAGSIYGVNIIGSKLGAYSLVVAAFSTDGSAQPRFSLPGIATAGSTSTFSIAYSSTPGSSSLVTHVASFGSTLADISNSLQLGLIDNQGIANALSSKINAASSAAAGGDSKTAKNVLGAFLNQLTAQSGKHITGIAPQVLQEDANSLIAQLP